MRKSRKLKHFSLPTRTKTQHWSAQVDKLTSKEESISSSPFRPQPPHHVSRIKWTQGPIAAASKAGIIDHTHIMRKCRAPQAIQYILQHPCWGPQAMNESIHVNVACRPPEPTPPPPKVNIIPTHTSLFSPTTLATAVAAFKYFFFFFITLSSLSSFS